MIRVILLLAVAACGLHASLLIENFNQPFSQHTIAGGSLPFTGHLFWVSFLDGSDATTPEGIRFRGYTCLDGMGPGCPPVLTNPQTADPLTMRLTHMTFSCDNPGGCPAFDITLVADFTVVTPPDRPVLITSFQIDGCTLASAVAPGTIGNCAGNVGGNPMSIAYYFGFTTSTADSQNSTSVEYGDSGFSNATGVNGNFLFSGGGLQVPSNRRFVLTQQFRIGGLVSIDENGQQQWGNWTGAIHFPGSITGTLDTTPVPEPAPWALTGLGVGLVMVLKRLRDKLARSGNGIRGTPGAVVDR